MAVRAANGLVLGLLFALLLWPAAGRGATCTTTPSSYTVTWGNDEQDAGGTLGDPGPDGQLSLREAVTHATNDLDPSTINLPPGTYDLSFALSLPGGCGLTIHGAGARVTTIKAGGSDRVFSNNEATTIEGVTITGGKTSGPGGGIINDNDLTLRNVAIVGNSGQYGGGVANQTNQTLTVTGSTFTRNHVANGSTTVEGGGAIFNAGTATITNTTISDNTAGENDASGGLGPGIFTAASKSTTLNFVTLANNRATSSSTGEGGNLGGPGTVYRHSTIIAGGSPDNCAIPTSTNSSGDQSIADDDTCGTLIQANPLLGPLADNGGPTDTHTLLGGSPALNAAEGSQCTGQPFDQRGVSRPQGPACDIGALELTPEVPVVPITTPGGTSQTPQGGQPDRILEELALKPVTFRALNSGGAIAAARKTRRGTTVTYTLTQAATVRFTVQRRVKGRKKGKRCVAGRRKGKRCTRYKAVRRSAFTRPSTAGLNHFKYSGRTTRGKLKPGRYRLVGVATTAAGLKSKALRARFRIVK